MSSFIQQMIYSKFQVHIHVHALTLVLIDNRKIKAALYSDHMYKLHECTIAFKQT